MEYRISLLNVKWTNEWMPHRLHIVKQASMIDIEQNKNKGPVQLF